MKDCKRCHNTKELTTFPTDDRCDDGRRNVCKACRNEEKRIYSLTKKGFTRILYNSQLNCSKIRGHSRPSYTHMELRAWLYSSPLYHTLHKAWVDSGYEKDSKPSIDRMDESIGYTWDNIQLMTWRENRYKQYIDRGRAVIQYDMNNNKIAEHYSLSEGARSVDGNAKSIVQACDGECKQHKGYVWRWVV